MTDITNLITESVDNAKKNGFKLVLNETPFDKNDSRKYWLIETSLKGYEGRGLEDIKQELAFEHSLAIHDSLDATRNAHILHPKYCQMIDQIEHDFIYGKPIIITVEGTLNEFVVQNRRVRQQSVQENYQNNKLPKYNRQPGQKPFSITCNSIHG